MLSVFMTPTIENHETTLFWDENYEPLGKIYE